MDPLTVLISVTTSSRPSPANKNDVFMDVVRWEMEIVCKKWL
jgi:hypothetical protein